MDLKILEEIANGTKEFIKYMGLNISNPHHSIIISSIVGEMFEHHRKVKSEKEAKKTEPKPVKITASTVEVNSNNINGK